MNSISANAANPYAPPQAALRDIIETDSAAVPAGLFERLIASIIDSLTVVPVFLPLLVEADWERIEAGAGSLADIAPAFSATGWTLTGIAAAVLIVITIRFVHANGQTVGKKAVGIKVVRSDGSRASLGRIFWLRNIVNGIPGAVPYVGNLYALVDHVFIFGKRRQCLHDRIADTIVVKA